MVFFGMIISSCGLVHVCPGTYCQPLSRKLISSIILSGCFFAFVVAFLGPRAGAAAGAGTVAEQERGARRGHIVVVLVLVFLFCGIVIV